MAQNTNNKSRKRPLDSDDEDDNAGKRRRIDNNHNHNHNTDGSVDVRLNEHYRKYSEMIKRISPYTRTNFNDEDDQDKDVMILSSTIPKHKDKEIRKLRMDVKELKEKLRILRAIAISKFDPDYNGMIEIDKENGMLASKGIAMLKKKKMRVYNARKITVQIAHRAHKKYKICIKSFLKRNKNWINHTNNAQNPEIAYHQDQWIKMNDLVQLRDQNERDSNGLVTANDVEELINNTALCTVQGIDGGTVIGEYIGLQVSISQMEDIYHRSADRCLANLFAFEMEIELDDMDDQDDDKDSEDDETEDENEQKELENVVEDVKQTGSKFVIDAIGYERLMCCDHKLLYVEPSNEEDSNVEYVTGIVNGWPRIFVVTKRDIEEGSVLCGYYGKTFKMAEYQRLRDKRNRSRIGVYIDRILKMPLFMTEREDHIV
eukprot:238795_1